MFEIFVEDSFSSAHHLEDYPGNCETSHGHNWLVKVTVAARKLDRIGLALDFRALKKKLAEVIDGLDHRDLNRLNFFRKLNPSSENIAFYVFRELKKSLRATGTKLKSVEVRETPGAGAIYSED